MAAHPSPPETDEPTSSRNALAKYSGIAIQMVAVIGAFTWAGVWLDGHFHTKTPWFTLVLVLTGVGLAMYQVIRSVTSES